MMTTSRPENTSFTVPTTLQDGSVRASTPAFRLDLLRSVIMHPVLASSVTSVSFILLLLYGSTIKPTYEAETLIHVQPAAITLFAEDSKSIFDAGRYDSFLQEEIQSMERPDTIAAALDRLPRNVWTEYGPSVEKATEQILARLKIARVTTSYQVSLILRGSDSRNTALIVNAITSAFLDSVRQRNLLEYEERAGLLTEERQRVASELRRDRDEQSALGASLGQANPDGEGNPYESELAALQEELVQARTSRDAAAARLTSLQELSGGHGSALAAEADQAILSDAGLSAFKTSINERRATLRGQMSGMTPDNPLRRKGQEELKDLDSSLEEMTTKLRTKSERDLQEKLRADLQRTGYVVARIHSQLAQRTAAATNSTPKLQRAAELNGDIKRLLLRQSEIENANRSLQLEVNSPGAIRLSLPAQVSSSPQGNRKQMFLLASFPLALMFGATAAIITRKYDQKIYTMLDVCDVFGFLPLTSVPARDEVSEAVIADHVFRLAGAVMSAYRSKGIRSFLLATVSVPTSIEPLSRVLLEKLRETGINACSISAADLLLPVHPDIQTDPGSLDSTESISFPAVEAKSQGFADAKIASLLAHKSLVLVKASQAFRCAETEYVARCLDATILVVESAVTKRPELVCAAESVHRLHVPAIGVVLQGVRRHNFDNPTRKLLAACNTPKERPKVACQEEQSLLKKSEVMSTFSPEIDTVRCDSPEGDQVTRKASAENAVPAISNANASVSVSQEVGVSVALSRRTEPFQDAPELSQCASEEFINPVDGVGLCNVIASSAAMASTCPDLTERAETALLSKQGANSFTKTKLSSAILLENHGAGERTCLQVSGRSVENTGDEHPLVARDRTSNAPSEHILDSVRAAVLDQLSGQIASVTGQAYERSSEKLSSLHQEVGWHAVPPADQNSVLTRQWRLLRRF